MQPIQTIAANTGPNLIFIHNLANTFTGEPSIGHDCSRPRKPHEERRFVHRREHHRIADLGAVAFEPLAKDASRAQDPLGSDDIRGDRRAFVQEERNLFRGIVLPVAAQTPCGKPIQHRAHTHAVVAQVAVRQRDCERAVGLGREPYF